MIKRFYIKVCIGMLVLLMLPFYASECHAREYRELTAVSGGDAVIGVEVEEVILPKELDLGDYQEEMLIGDRQLLMITVLPEDTTDKTLTFASSNTKVATINGMGRITAVGLGETVISVSCGDVVSTFPLKVVEDSTKKAVQDIEIGDYEEELKVDSTLQLSATVLPNDALDTTVKYESSDNNIATVNSSGEVKGISPGEVTIYISAGGVKKQITLTVKVGTTELALNSDYVVLKPEATFQIEANVMPEGAPGKVSYRSLDEEIATVSKEGLITAVACGDTAIIVANDDIQVSVSVVVNHEGSMDIEIPLDEKVGVQDESSFPDEVGVSSYPVISSRMLKYFYENEKVLTIKGEEYTIFLDGKDIVNFENELTTNIVFEQVEEGIVFVVNGVQKLCGKLVIDISSKIGNQKYLYLFNDAKQKYERLAVEDIGLLTIDTEGTYLLTSEELSGFTWNRLLLGIGVAVIVIGIAVYIGIKKQYWFW